MESDHGLVFSLEHDLFGKPASTFPDHALVGLGAVDHVPERNIFVAFGVAANGAHFFQVVLGLEQVALLGLPHAVIGPGQRVVGIGGERLVVPIFGVVVAAELAAGVADQGGDIDVVVIAHGAQHRDAAGIVALVVDQRIGLVPVVEEFFGRSALLLLGLMLGGRGAGRLRVLRRRRRAVGLDGGGKAWGADGDAQDDGGKHGGFAHGLLPVRGTAIRTPPA